MTAALEELDLDFKADGVRDWAYQTPDKEILPYGAGINYFARGLSVSELAKENMTQARAAQISESGYFLGAKGLRVGFIHCERPDAESPTQLKFESHVPLDESMSGDQPPITGFYPRVVLPPEGEFKYAILMGCDKGIFGSRFENHTIDIPRNTHPSSVVVPRNVPCEKAVKAALSEFLQGFDHENSLPEGEYSLNMEIERMPLFAVRIDGYRPLSSKTLDNGQMPKELPLANRYPHGILDYKLFDINGSAPRENPLIRMIYPDEKYVELPFVGPSDIADKLIDIGKVSLEHDGVEDHADLVYIPVRRSESIQETDTNPHFGLVEVQISRVAKVNGVTVNYKPKEVEQPKSLIDTLALYSKSESADDLTMDEHTRDIKGFTSTSTPVNTGRTIFANARTGAVSPKIAAEWDGHAHTFRFCLTNHL